MNTKQSVAYKVSVIVPVYNAEKTICRCLDSILSQTYDNLEVLLVNDGSIDRSIDICYEYERRDSRIILVDTHNQGAFLARKTGYERATGDFIGFVDSDDFILPSMYEYLVGVSIHDDVDIVESAYCTVNLEGNVVDKYICKNESVILGSANILRFYYTSGLQIAFSLCNKIFAKYLFDEIEDCPVRKWDDISLLIQLLTRSRSISIKKELFYNYVQSCNSTTRSSYSLNRLDEIFAAKFIYNYHKKNNPAFCDFQIANILISSIINYYHLSCENVDSSKPTYCLDSFNFYFKKTTICSLLKLMSYKEFSLVLLFKLSPFLSNLLISLLKKL